MPLSPLFCLNDCTRLIDSSHYIINTAHIPGTLSFWPPLCWWSSSSGGEFYLWILYLVVFNQSSGFILGWSQWIFHIHVLLSSCSTYTCELHPDLLLLCPTQAQFSSPWSPSLKPSICCALLPHWSLQKPSRPDCPRGVFDLSPTYALFCLLQQAAESQWESEHGIRGVTKVCMSKFQMFKFF